MKKSLTKDLDLRIELSKAAFKSLREYFTNMSDEAAKKNNIDKAKCIELCSEENAIKNANDTVKVENYLKAKKIEEQSDHLKNCAQASQERTGFKPVSGLARAIYSFMKPENTPNEEINQQNRLENDKLIKQVSSVEGARQFINSQIREIYKFDFKEILTKSPSEILDSYEEMRPKLGLAFALYSAYENSSLKPNSDVKEIIENNLTLIESCANYRTIVERYSSPFYLVTPEVLTKDPNAPIGALEYIQKNKADIEEFSEMSDSDVIGLFYGDYGKNVIYSDGKNVNDRIKELYEKFPNAKGDFVKNNYFVDKETGNVVKMFDILKVDEPDKILDLNTLELKEYTPEQKYAMGERFNDAVKSNRLNIINYMFGHKDSILGTMNDIRNRRAWFSFSNSDQYNELVEKIDEMKKIYNSPLLKSRDTINSMNTSDVEQMCKNMVDTIKDVMEKVDAYIDAKKDQPKNATRQFRFDKCNELKSLVDLNYIDNNVKAMNSALPATNTGSFFDMVKENTLSNENVVVEENVKEENTIKENKVINQEEEKIQMEISESEVDIDDLNKSFYIEEEEKEEFLESINSLESN